LEPAALHQKIHESITRTRSRINRLRAAHTTLAIAAIAGSGLSALLAGGAALVGVSFFGGEALGWQVVCGLASALAFVGTLASTSGEQLHLGEKLSEARYCAGRLSALELALNLGEPQPEEVARRYGELLQDFQTVLG